MTQPAKSQEPSMEEILASIRRIIADDDATKSAPPPPEAPKPAVQPAPAPPPLYAAPPVAPPPRPRPAAEARAAVEAPATPRGGPAVADPSSDILDLTESMTAPVSEPPAASPPASAMPQPTAQFRTIDGSSDVEFDEVAEKSPAPVAAPVKEERGRLISSETSAAVDSAFNALAQTVLVQNARTLEDLVHEMLRPMLKSWLDDNLPGMVERLVRAEIERVSRGRVG